MAAIRHLSKAPITEAIIDFRATLPETYRVESLRAAGKKIQNDYPTIEEQRSFEGQFKINMKDGELLKPVSSRGGLRGFLFRSADRIRIAQFRIDGFTFNRLSPYSNWIDIRNEALRLWDVYRHVSAPDRLERIALRYLNRITIPPRGSLKTYLAVEPPRIPGVPSHLGSFLLRLGTFDPETHYVSNVTLALEHDADPTRSLIILDIEVYTTRGLGLLGEDLVPILERLHAMKNEIFFGTITEQTARMYGG